MLRRLTPDEPELQIAATVCLAGCPFCGSHPIAWVDANDTTGLFVGRVTCTNCRGGMHYCGSTREEAREGAIKDWSRRVSPEKQQIIPTWGVHDDAGNCIAIITHVGRASWWVEDYTENTAACFRSRSQAFYYATSVIG